MTKIIIDTEESAVKYIEKVLSEWTSFCRTQKEIHGGRKMTVIGVIIGVIFIGLFITLAIDIIGK